MHPILLASLLLCTLLGGCTRRVVTYSSASSVTTPNTLVAGTFITGSGSWTHRQGSIGQELEVHASSSDVVWSYNFSSFTPHGSSSSGSTGTSKPIADKGKAPWFIYVESPDRFWFFDGKTELTLQQSNGSNLSDSRVISKGKLLEEAEQVPADLIPRLPADMQALLPKPADPAKRPSI